MTSATVMLVEDDLNLRQALSDSLELAGYACVIADCGESAIALLNKNQPDIIISDVQMPGMNTHVLLKLLREKTPSTPVLMMTAYGNVENAVQFMQEGASDYLSKPFSSNELIEKISLYLPKNLTDGKEPIAVDPSSVALFSLAKRVSYSHATVLISGESGTGKEVLARYIHDHSHRANKEFVAINCAAIPENMLEATLFGYEKGSFTGAYKSTPGKFEQAQGGTLLLDEISEMDLSLQAKLLRVLQEKEVERLGGQKVIALDVRIIATTNRDLREEVRKNRFREDLFYRLNVFPLKWVPLSERKLDIIPLAEYIIEKHCKDSGARLISLSKKAIDKLKSYDWPGNARELDNVMQRALILCSSGVVEEKDIVLEADSQQTSITVEKIKKISSKKDKEKEFIVSSIKSGKYSRKELSDKLGISSRTLRYRLAKMKEEGWDICDE